MILVRGRIRVEIIIIEEIGNLDSRTIVKYNVHTRKVFFSFSPLIVLLLFLVINLLHNDINININILLKLSKEASSNSGSKSGNSGLGKGGKLKPVFSPKPCAA